MEFFTWRQWASEKLTWTELQKYGSLSRQQGTQRVNKPPLFVFSINLTPPLFSNFLLKSWLLFPVSPKFWVLFLPGWSSARSSLRIPCPHSRLCPVSLQHLVSGWAPRSLQIYGSPALPSLRRRFLLSCPRLPGRGAEPRNWEEQPVSTSHQESRALALENQGGNARLASYLVGSLNVSV